MTDGVSSEPVIAPLPTPISVEPRSVAPAEAAEIARQADESKLPKPADKPAKAEPVAEKTNEKAKPLSTRDALRAAREKVEAEPVAEKASPLKADPKTAEPAAKADAKTDSKAAEPAAKAAEPTRAPDGKFVSADPTKAAAPAAEPAAKAADAPKPAALPSHTAEPPPARFSAAAKERWAEAPEEVRAEVSRAVTELTKGFEKHRASAERDATLAEFHEMAGKGGKNLRDVVAGYVGMENALRADPIKGFELICQNAGISFRDVAAKYLNQAPDAAASQADATILELRRELADLKQGLGAIQQERAQARTDTTTESVAKFAADHPRFEELAEDIAFFLKTRTKDLAEAYKLAERLNPAPAAEPKPEVVPPTPAAASSAAPVVAAIQSPKLVQTDRGEKSIAGAPSAGSDPVRKQPSSSIKEALQRAKQRAG